MIELDLKQVKNFLNRNFIHDYEIKKIAGDASFRSYYRILYAGKSFILMFAPPQYEDIKPFVAIDKILIDHNFSAPKIFAQDDQNGFLLLEDLGDDTYSRVLAKEYSKNFEEELYKKASDCLLELHKNNIGHKVALYNNATLFREVMLFIDWYLPLHKKMISLDEKARFKFLWFELFDFLSKENQVLVLRDYHADNLMFLPQRSSGYKQVGLLDFQDALVGSKAYDLVSLLEDARRDIDSENRDKIFNYYLENSKVDKASFIMDYEILSLQRNIKIVGIFSRLSLRDNKHHYLDLLPRVLDFIKVRLHSNNPVFFQIGNFLKKFL